MSAFWKSRTKPWTPTEKLVIVYVYVSTIYDILGGVCVYSFIFHLQQFESKQKVCLFYDDSFALVNLGI